MSDGARGWLMGKKRQFVLVMGGDTVEAWVLLVMSILGWVGMEVVGGEHTGHIKEGLATQWDMLEHFLCARLEQC